MGHARDRLHTALEIGHDLRRALGTRPRREQRRDEEIALVLLRNEPHRDGREAVIGEGHEADIEGDDDDPHPQEPPHHRPVGAGGEVEKQIEEAEKSGKEPVDGPRPPPACDRPGGEQPEPHAPLGSPRRQRRRRQPGRHEPPGLEEPDGQEPGQQCDARRGERIAPRR